MPFSESPSLPRLPSLAFFQRLAFFRKTRLVTEATLSFRDPDGSCMRFGDRIIRFVYPAAATRVREFLASDFTRQLLEEKVLPATRLLPQDEFAELLALGQFAKSKNSFAGGLALEHERIVFPSYPFEWCPEMLFAAAELTLTLQLRALAAGLTLKDATPLNLLFRGAQPVFVDFLSFSPRSPGAVTWSAYAQFVRTFLFPLMLSKWQGNPLADHFLANSDGLVPAEVYQRLTALGRIRPLALQYVSLPTWLGGMATAETARTTDGEKTDDPERALYVSQALVRGLARALHQLKPKQPGASVWANYMDTFSYQDETFAAKQSFVREALRELAPSTVLDIGCNTGYFSCLAAELGASVVALDSDVNVVSKLWLRSLTENRSVLPLVMDFSRPSPGLGWRNSEKMSFLARARGNFDAALLLAVVHHLTVTHAVPLEDVFEVCADIVTQGVIVEFVPPEDPMWIKIGRNKEHLVPRLQQANFDAAYGPWFTLVRRLQLPASSRWIYFLRRKA